MLKNDVGLFWLLYDAEIQSEERAELDTSISSSEPFQKFQLLVCAPTMTEAPSASDPSLSVPLASAAPSM